jgi:predicted oxidoreductase
MTIEIELTPDGLRLSRIVAGMMRLNEWQLSIDELVRWIEACLEMGITTFDHADIYGSYTVEALFGAALARQPGLRDRLQLVTKCGIALLSPNRPNHRVKHYNTTRRHIVASAENSLRNLQTDQIDLLLIHRPDPLLTANEVAAAFEKLLASGKVRHFGVSNFTPYQFDLLQSACDMPLVTNQVELSLLHMEPLHDGTLDHAQQHGYGPMAWSPVGGGAIFRPNDDRSQRVHAELQRLSAKYDAELDQIALAWLMRLPSAVVPVMGSGKLTRLRHAVAAVDLTNGRQDWYALWQASAGAEVP